MREQITLDPTYRQILKDSFGGVMYNVANRHKYDTTELVKLWLDLSRGERAGADGIMQGVFSFISAKEY